MPKIDWVQAQKDYLDDPKLSLKDIAIKYGVAENTVQEHSSREKWVASREVTQQNTLIQAGEIIVSRNSQINEKHNKQYTDMQILAINMVRIASNTIQRKAKEKGIENLTVYEKDMISPKALKDLYESLKIAMDGERVTVGLPTSVERKEFTGKDGNDLFAKLEPTEFYAHLERAFTSLDTGATGSGSTETTSGSSS